MDTRATACKSTLDISTLPSIPLHLLYRTTTYYSLVRYHSESNVICLSFLLCHIPRCPRLVNKCQDVLLQDWRLRFFYRTDPGSFLIGYLQGPWGVQRHPGAQGAYCSLSSLTLGTCAPLTLSDGSIRFSNPLSGMDESKPLALYPRIRIRSDLS